MDMFFAACEQLRNPELSDKMFGIKSGTRLATTNYNARKYGIRAGAPIFLAKEISKQVAGKKFLMLKSNRDFYKKKSAEVEKILKNYDSQVLWESPGLDEGVIDLTPYLNKKFGVQKWSDSEILQVVEKIRKEVFDGTGLTCSAGIGRNRLIAKLAADVNKPNGQHLIEQDEMIPLVRKMNVRKIPGIGPKLEFILRESLEIITVQDLYEKRNLLPLVFTQAQLELFTSAMMASERQIRPKPFVLENLINLKEIRLGLGLK